MAERPFGQAEDRQENAMLRGRKKADAAVIGGGFTGLHTALLLARAGLRVALLEADTLGGGASARCAGTVGLLGRALLCDTEKSYGKEAAARYVEAQQAAFQTLRDLLPKCDSGVRFRERDLYLTAENEREKKRLEQEHRAMQRAGLNAELTQATQCPRPNVLSIRIQGQGTLEPPAYLRSLERLCAEKGVQLYEHSRVIAAESNLVYTQKGSVLAPYLIIATGFPVINVPGWYFLRLWQSQGYVLPLCGAGNANSTTDNAKRFLTFRIDITGQDF
ncbi:MAG: FAD-binding oxidoreductase [Clostridia bacterium]|nr:FAD-binding oxidoreductase [Clostridia bacterium]